MDQGLEFDEAGLFDSNILIDELKGLTQATSAIGAYSDQAISIITWMEVLAGAGAKDEPTIRAYLASFLIIPLSSAIAERAATIRPTTRLKLPDAIILATAQIERRILITRNSRDFDPHDATIRFPTSSDSTQHPSSRTGANA